MPGPLFWQPPCLGPMSVGRSRQLCSKQEETAAASYKILSWPKDPEENAIASKQVGGKEKEKDKARNSSRGSKTDGKSKKKKENLVELHHDPPIVKTLGSAVMPLKNLVSGDMQISSVCNLEPFYSNTEQQQANDKNPEKSNNTKERKLKSDKEHPKTLRSSSGKEKQKDAEMKPTEEDPLPPIVALTVEVEVQLVC